MAKRKGMPRGWRRKPTSAETRLWLVLREQRLGGFAFKRFYPLNSYVVDFYCPQVKLVVMIEGREIERPDYATIRDMWLRENGHHIFIVTPEDVLKDRGYVILGLLTELKLLIDAPDLASPDHAINTPNAVQRTRALHRQQATAENKLWRLLQSKHFRGYKFYRQHALGRFVVCRHV